MNSEFRITYWLTILLVLMAGCKDDDVVIDYPTDRLVSYFSFENHLADSEGNTPPGVINGGVDYIDGKGGNGIALNGIDQYISFDRSSFHQDNQVSISVWFKTNEGGPSKTFISCSNFKAASGSATASFTIITTVVAAGSAAPATGNRWHHLVGTWDGANMRFYLNGIQEAWKDATGTLYDDNDDLTIGFFNSVWWAGSVDEIHIYSRALEQSDITELYERGN